MPLVEGALELGAMLRSGVYLLLHRGTVVYVGQSKQVLRRVYAHRVVWAAKRKGRRLTQLRTQGILFDDFLMVPCPEDRLDGLERELIQRFRPRCNTLLKGREPVGEVRLRVLGQVLSLLPEVAKPVGPVRRVVACT